VASAPAELIVRKDRTHQCASNAMDFSRIYLKQVVAIHQAMFERLLFAEDANVSLELAELFHDAGRTYLQISERINEAYLSHHSLQD
jgi:hypothetical protein